MAGKIWHPAPRLAYTQRSELYPLLLLVLFSTTTFDNADSALLKPSVLRKRPRLSALNSRNFARTVSTLTASESTARNTEKKAPICRPPEQLATRSTIPTTRARAPATPRSLTWLLLVPLVPLLVVPWRPAMLPATPCPERQHRLKGLTTLPTHPTAIRVSTLASPVRRAQATATILNVKFLARRAT